MKAGFTLVLTISLGRGARCWVEEEALIGLHQYHTVEKTHQAMMRKLCGLVFCRFVWNPQVPQESSGVQVAHQVFLRFFCGF